MSCTFYKDDVECLTCIVLVCSCEVHAQLTKLRRLVTSYGMNVDKVLSEHTSIKDDW
jgi:hypothetical protein